MEEKEPRPISQFFIQRLVRQIGLADSTQLGNDIFYEIRALNTLISYFGEDFIKEVVASHNEKWEDLKLEIERIDKFASRIKPVWDLIEEKKLSKIDKETAGKEKFLKYAGKISIFGNPVTRVLTWVIMATGLQRYKVPTEDYKVLEHGGTRVADAMKNKNKKSEGSAG